MVWLGFSRVPPGLHLGAEYAFSVIFADTPQPTLLSKR